MNLDISFTPEAACELSELENYMENVPQGSVFYTLSCLFLSYTLSWLDRAEKTVKERKMNFLG